MISAPATPLQTGAQLAAAGFATLVPAGHGRWRPCTDCVWPSDGAGCSHDRLHLAFRALLHDEPGSGNAGLAVTSPPPAWAGFRKLAVTAITRESDSAIRLEDPTGAPVEPPAAGSLLICCSRPHDDVVLDL